MKDKLWTMALALVVLPVAADESAAEETEEKEPRFTQQVVVTATMPELATEERLRGEELAEGPEADLAAALRGQPGLEATRRGPINLDPTIRGLSEQQLGLFVDGTRTFAAGPGRMDSGLSHVSLHAAETVRVVKGPYALAWGAGTMSAIRVETVRRPFSDGPLETTGRVGLGYGESAGASDAFVSYGGATDRYRFQLFFNDRQGDDYEDGGGEEVEGEYRSRDARWSFGIRPTERLTLEYSGGYQKQNDIDYPGRLLDANYFRTRSHAVELDWSPADRSMRLRAQAYVNDKEHLMNNDDKPTATPDPLPIGIDVRLPAESETIGGRVGLTWDRERFEWSVGSDYYRSEQTAERTITNRANGAVLFEDRVWPDAEIADLGLYGQLVYKRPTARIGATVRVDRVDADAGEVSDFFSVSTSGDLDQQETNVSAAVSAEIGLDEHWSLTVGAGRTVRTASALERYADRFPSTKFQRSSEFLGNPELDPEESLELNVGTHGRFRRFEVTVEAFARGIDDYITVLPDPSLATNLPLSPPPVFRYINGDEARFYGGEARVRQELVGGLEWRGSVSYTRAEDTFFDEPAFGIPPPYGELALCYRGSGARPWWVETSARIFDRQHRVAEERFEQETPGYTVHDLLGVVELGRGLSLQAGVENLFDKHYADHLNAPDPFTGERIDEIGRSAFVEVSYLF